MSDATINMYPAITMIFRMRLALLLVVSFALSALPPQSSRGGVRRVDYSKENFSIAVPTTWSEIEPAVLAAMPDKIRQAAPSAPEFKISYGFRAYATPGPNYPWVAIIFTGDRVDETMFEKLEWASHTVDDLTKKWESSGGTLEKAQMKNMFYDKGRHLLWAMSQSTFAGVGDLQTLSGVYLTTTGSIQVHCYSKAVEFAKYRPVCQGIIESVILNPKIVIVARPGKQ